jgi:hypothetical protein
MVLSPAPFNADGGSIHFGTASTNTDVMNHAISRRRLMNDQAPLL